MNQDASEAEPTLYMIGKLQSVISPNNTLLYPKRYGHYLPQAGTMLCKNELEKLPNRPKPNVIQYVKTRLLGPR